MLNYRPKPRQDEIFIKITIWGANLVLNGAPKFGPHPGGSYGGQGDLSFYVGAKGRQWSQISHRKLKISISNGVVILASEPGTMLSRGQCNLYVLLLSTHKRNARQKFITDNSLSLSAWHFDYIPVRTNIYPKKIKRMSARTTDAQCSLFSELLGLGRQIGMINSSVFQAKLSAPILVQ